MAIIQTSLPINRANTNLAVLYEGTDVRVETLLAPGQSRHREATCPSVSSWRMDAIPLAQNKAHLIVMVLFNLIHF